MYNANSLQPVSGSARATHMGSTEEGATECAGWWCGDMIENPENDNATGKRPDQAPTMPAHMGNKGKGTTDVACHEGRHHIGQNRVQCKQLAARVKLRPCHTYGKH